MDSIVADFGPFHGRIWMNASSLGVMPRVAREAIQIAIKWSAQPYRVDEAIFEEVPAKLKATLGKLIGAPPEEIILGNSASYGLHLWANGIPFEKGDEVLLVKGDFPASILPWLYLRKKGITVTEIQPQGMCLHPNDLEGAITPSTRVVCATWVDSFTGFKLDASAIGDVCKRNDILFLLNVTQALGADPFDVSKIHVDGITSTGYKWLCGPYGTGFCWMKLNHINSLDYNQAYWIPMQGNRELDNLREYQILENIGAAQYDVFGTANFFNFVPWNESIALLLKYSIPKIKKHNLSLVNYLHDHLDQTKYKILSPHDKSERTAILIISHQEPTRNKAIYKMLQEKKVFISFREGYLRFSPHLYNTKEDIEKTIKILNSIR